MPYLIDGHNLIPKVRGLSLQHEDDEQRLIEMLQVFCRLQRRQVELYFDRSQVGGRRVQTHGTIKVHFAAVGNTADRLIEAKLRRMKGEARNWTVVSSDRVVQSAARAARASVLTSEAFADQLQKVLDHSPDEGSQSDPSPPSEDELDDWLSLFRDKRAN